MRVLLVDKEADLLPSLQATLLAVEGLELYCAPDGPTAREHATLLGGVDALITEVFLPGVDGVELRNALLAIKPTMHTVFLTRHEHSAQGELPSGCQLLPVPVDPQLVLSALRTPPPKPAAYSPATAAQTPPAAAIKEAAPALVIPELQPVPPTLPSPAPAQAATSAPSPPTPIPAESATQTTSAPAQDPSLDTVPAPSPPLAPCTPEAAAPTLAPPATPPPVRELVPGMSLGPYKLLRKEPDTRWGPCFAAVHSSLDRSVLLVTLPARKQGTDALRAEFLAEASAKALAQHPTLLTVYEAGELDGHLFYAIEHLETDTLRLQLEGAASLPFSTLQLVAWTVAEGLQYFQQARLPHRPLTIEDILLGPGTAPRLQNLAVPSGSVAASKQSDTDDIATLGNTLHRLLSPDAPRGFRELLERTTPSHARCIRSWEEFIKQLADLAPDEQGSSPVKSVTTFKPSDFEMDFEPERPSRLGFYGLAVVVLVVMAFAVVWHLRRPQPPVPVQAEIPAGEYLVGASRKVTLRAFSIDSTEISNWQYAQFVNWLRLHPKEAGRYDHPDQPAHQNHIPEGWAQLFPEKIRPDPQSANPNWELPVTKVSWWDAFAFANWTGRALPTEEEWEAAGRGTRGFLFPWGDEPDLERAHVKRNTETPGATNGPVAVQLLKDASAFGVLGLCGNVSEWTATRPDGKTAVAKGNHYDSPLLSLDARATISTETHSPRLGFRTVLRKANP